MHLLIDGLNIKRGGGITVLELLITGLLREGFTCSVLTTSTEVSDHLTRRFGELNVLLKPRLNSLAFAAGYRYGRLDYLVRKIGANAVLGFNYWSPTHTFQVTFHINVIPFLSMRERVQLVGPVRAVAHRYFAKKALANSQLNIFESNHVRDLAKQLVPRVRRPETHYVGVTLRQGHAGSVPVRKQIIAVTSGNAHKRNDLLIDLHRLMAEHEETRGVQLLIAGSEAQIRRQLNTSDNDYIASINGVKFLGYLSADELTVEMSRSIALVTFSEFESFYMVAIEAMMARCPVIAANTSSAAESVGSAGVLVRQGDLPAVRNQIQRLLDVEVRQDYVERGLEWIEKFDADRCHHDIAKTISRVFSEQRSVTRENV